MTAGCGRVSIQMLILCSGPQLMLSLATIYAAKRAELNLADDLISDQVYANLI